MNINGSTIHVEGELGLTGLGYVGIYTDNSPQLKKTVHRGSSGYGGFNVDNFTDRRVITLHPPKVSYPLMGL
jgi:hypothetical protein